MPLTNETASEIARLLNTQNSLTTKYTASRILKDQERYIVRYGDDGEVLGAIEVKSVQWYQCEIDHLSVGTKRRGTGAWLVEQAEAKARRLNARIAQCTIRVGNVESEGLFQKCGYQATITFLNKENANEVTVYQKNLVTSKKEG